MRVDPIVPAGTSNFNVAGIVPVGERERIFFCAHQVH